MNSTQDNAIWTNDKWTKRKKNKQKNCLKTKCEIIRKWKTKMKVKFAVNVYCWYQSIYPAKHFALILNWREKRLSLLCIHSVCFPFERPIKRKKKRKSQLSRYRHPTIINENEMRYSTSNERKKRRNITKYENKM